MSKFFTLPNGPLPWYAKPHDFTGDNMLGIYTVETTQRYVLGTTYTTWDGREFVYSKSSGACISGQGAKFGFSGYTAYTNFAVTAAVGDTQVSVPAATHATLSEDELAGGYICIFNGVDNNVQFRGIVGNDAASANAAFIVYLDGALNTAITVAFACETYQNPYGSLATAVYNYDKKAGLPAREITASGYYFWLQRKGPTWAAPQGGKWGTTEGGYNGGLWSDVGNISDFATSLGVTVAGGRGSQYAGYAMLGDADNIGPLFMLQG
jgi:hypothetical protein